MGKEMKIGIVVEDTGLYGIDFSHVNEGNPGVGGTVYEEILLAYTLIRNDKAAVYLYVHNKENKFFDGVKIICVNDVVEMLQDASERELDILLFCTGKSSKWYEAISSNNIKCIAWAHGFLNYYELKKLKSTEQIKRVVFVGKNMYYSYIADDIIMKSTYIYNMFEPKFSIQRRSYKHDVCYLGALNRYKGFHVLAKAWPKVIKYVPDAQLYVMGKGNLYNRNSTLGKYEIAENRYERKFIKYLIDESKKILPSVHFLGNVGKEKTELISKMCVGVVNPTAITETFCISAIEIGACGVPVCTKGEYGLLDTVINGQTGLFSNNSDDLADNIIRLLNDKKLNNDMSENAIMFARKFAPNNLICEWIKVFDDVLCGKNALLPGSEINLQSIPWFKKMLYSIRIENGIRCIPSFIKYEYFLKRMGRVYFRDVIYHYIGKDV